MMSDLVRFLSSLVNPVSTVHFTGRTTHGKTRFTSFLSNHDHSDMQPLVSTITHMCPLAPATSIARVLELVQVDVHIDLTIERCSSSVSHPKPESIRQRLTIEPEAFLEQLARAHPQSDQG